MLSVPIGKDEERKKTKQKEKEMTYDYEKAVRDDVRKEILSCNNYDKDIAKCGSIDEVAEELAELMLTDDYVTGNASGSYTCNRVMTKTYLDENEYLIVDALENYGADTEDYKMAILNPHFADVSIRCYLLREAIYDVLEEPKVKRYVQGIIGTKKVQSNNRKPVKKTVKKKPAKKPAKKVRR